MPEDIDADLCTHIIFAFGWLKKGKLSSFESNDETKNDKKGLYEKINDLKSKNSNLKTLLAIGKSLDSLFFYTGLVYVAGPDLTRVIGARMYGRL